MTWNYAYNPNIWLSVGMVVLMVVLSSYSARRRSVPGATYLMVASLFAAMWAAGSLLEAAAVNPEIKIFWFKFQAIVQLPMIVATSCFVLEYAWPGRWLTRRNLALLSIPCLLAFDIHEASPELMRALVKEAPHLALLALDPESDRLLVLSGQASGARTIGDLTEVIQKHAEQLSERR